MGDVEPNRDTESKKTHECMKGTARTLVSRKPMSQEENPVVHLHWFLLFPRMHRDPGDGHKVGCGVLVPVTECGHTIHTHVHKVAQHKALT